MLRDMRADCFDSLRILHDRSHANALCDLRPFFLCEPCFICESSECFIDRRLIHMQLYRNRLKVKRKGRLVAN